MTAIPQQVAARIGTTQQTNYIRKTVNLGDAGLTSPTNPFCKIPKNAFITNVNVEIVTAFNAATTNVLTVGTTTASANEVISAVDLPNPGLVGITNVARGRGTGLTAAADLYLYVKYTQTGTVATTGKANITIEYIPDNDG